MLCIVMVTCNPVCDGTDWHNTEIILRNYTCVIVRYGLSALCVNYNTMG